jgi:SAM-dependent methyltransferase
MSNFNVLIERINLGIARSFPYKGRVVDLGCGTAPYKADILKVADEYIGVDWENSFHDTSSVDLFADLTKTLPMPDGFADTVTAFQVMEHVPDPLFFLSECHRILRFGGRIHITVPYLWQIHDAPYDYFRYTRHGLERLLSEAGFADTEISETTGFWQTWILLFNYHTARNAPGWLRFLLCPLWWVGQRIAPWFDRHDPDPGCTASYAVTARKR